MLFTLKYSNNKLLLKIFKIHVTTGYFLNKQKKGIQFYAGS